MSPLIWNLMSSKVCSPAFRGSSFPSLASMPAFWPSLWLNLAFRSTQVNFSLAAGAASARLKQHKNKPSSNRAFMNAPPTMGNRHSKNALPSHKYRKSIKQLETNLCRAGEQSLSSSKLFCITNRKERQILRRTRIPWRSRSFFQQGEVHDKTAGALVMPSSTLPARMIELTTLHSRYLASDTSTHGRA